jgi:photosystem II stability/assembly factor-like uncharacterized protein
VSQRPAHTANLESNSVLFVGTSDGLAIYRADGRGAWRRVGQALVGAAVRAIIAADAQTLLVAADGRPPQQSFDGGVTWSDTAGSPPEPIGAQVATLYGPMLLAYARLSGATAYARLGGQPPALLGAGADGSFLFRSEDDGIHWQAARIDDDAIGRVTTIVPATDRRDAAWAGTASGALLRTADRGRSWQLVAREQAAILCLAAALDEE